MDGGQARYYISPSGDFFMSYANGPDLKLNDKEFWNKQFSKPGDYWKKFPNQLKTNNDG